MKKIYYLANCDTCRKIIKDLGGLKEFEFQNIKETQMTGKQLDEMKKMTGSYDALFSRRAMKYKSMGLKDKDLTEKQIRQLILDEYTFLKRPVIISENEIFVGNAKTEVARANEYLNG